VIVSGSRPQKTGMLTWIFVMLAVIYSGNENEAVLKAIDETVRRLDEEYGPMLRGWGGLAEEVAPIEDELRPILARGKGPRSGGKNRGGSS